MIIYSLLLLVGLVGLWISADKTVDNAEKLIKALGIPSFLFGAVFMSISTGLPEIATAVISVYEGVPELSAGDITGSSFVNLTFVLGAAIFAGKGLKLKGEDLDLIRDAGIATVIAASVLILFKELSLLVVLILLSLYAIFLYKAEHSAFEMKDASDPSKKTVIYTLAGVGALLLSARLMVAGAKGIGEILGIPVEIVGATVVAVGTGLPELAFEIAALKEGNTSLALGDMFGSTLVNITLTLSVLGLLSTPSMAALVPVLFGIVIVGILALLFSRRGDFSMFEGAILLLIFILYLVWHVL